MSSRSIHIANFREAVDDGTIPGSFNDDSTVFEFPRVESVNSRGARLIWIARVRLLDGDELVSFDGPHGDVLIPQAELPEGLTGEITTESYQISAKGVRGKTRDGGKPTVVRSGKNLGKVNATNVATQALRDALGRYNAQVKRASRTAAPGEKAPGEGAPDTPLCSERPPPMLVKRIGETREATLTPEVFAQGVTVQRKYNGVRMVAFDAGPVSDSGSDAGSDPGSGPNTIHLYSRTKGNYPGFPHIRAELAFHLGSPPPVPEELLQPPPGCGEALGPDEIARLQKIYKEDRVHLDGEIYLHGQALIWISGQARREEDENNLNLMVFDCFFPGAKAANHDMASANRQKYLDLLFAAATESDHPFVHVKRVKNYPVAGMQALESLRDKFLAKGYEGAIARKDCAGYRYSYNNYHSANLVKVKPKFDSEFEVVGYTEGKKGKDVGAVIWICKVDPENRKSADDKFNVVPKDMSYDERRRIFRCLGEEVENSPEAIAEGEPARLTRFDRDFKGRPLTVEYPERSLKTGKPVQAKALTFRTYEGDIAADPLRRLYTECDE